MCVCVRARGGARARVCSRMSACVHAHVCILDIFYHFTGLLSPFLCVNSKKTSSVRKRTQRVLYKAAHSMYRRSAVQTTGDDQDVDSPVP